MAKYSDNDIQSLADDWGYDRVNGLPYSGKSVQKFIKDNLGAITRACFFDTRNATLLWFASEEERDAYRDDPDSFDRTKILYSVPIIFSSDLFRINLVNHNGVTSINIATNEERLVLSLGFQVQQKSVTETIWHGTERAVKVAAYIDAGATGSYTIIHEPQTYGPGQDYEVDVRRYLTAGANRVKIQFVDDDDDSISATIIYSISLTNLYIELMDNTWYLPIVEGGDEANYKLGGFKIVGSVNKILHLDIYSATSDVRLREFTYNLYNNSFDKFDYKRAQGFDLGHRDGMPDLTTGVYLVSAYLTSGYGEDMLTTDAVNYNIMYITASDVTSAQLVCMNSVADEIYNYTDSEMFHYAIYNKNINVGSPHIVVSTRTGTSPTELENKTLQDIETGVEQIYTVSLNWLTDETINIFVSATMEYGNTQFVEIPVDNSKTFPPTRGADFFLNSASRDNSNANYLKLINEINKQELTPEWNRMVWVDGVDGWIRDDIGKKGLYIRAGSSMSLPFTEKTLMSGDNISLEMCYRISNVADYDETVISIADDRDAVGFRGIRIRPTNITVHSSNDAQEPNDYLRSVNVMDEQVIHLVITINKGAGGPNMNLVTGYINGCKNFQFDYTTNAQWLVQGPFIVGAEKSDVSIYCIRTYPFVLSSRNVQDNYINSIEFSDRAGLKEFIRSATESDESTISYESVKNNNNNFFVIEMLNGQSYPSAANGWTKKTSGLSNIEMHFGWHPEWDWKAYGAYTTGQGTTSMGYYRWNIRWRVDDKSIGKKAPVSYLSSRTKEGNKYVYEWADGSSVKSFDFDGSGRHPKTSRITAKINFASSMQSHKMGATFAYNELHNNIDRSSESDSNIGLLNEAQVFAMDNSMPMPSVSVYQYPAYGFVKHPEDDSYEFIGLFTIGPDKGDKSTFGFNIDDSISDTLITLEGTDHDRDVVMFGYPWDQNMIFKTSDECLNVTSGNDRGGWEVGNCYTYDTGVETDAAGINSILYQEFKPAYDAVFNNSTMIFGIDRAEYDNASASDILAVINADPAAFGSLKRTGNRFPNSSYQFWIDGEYILYYRSASGNRQYVAGIDLEDTLGTPAGSTVAEKNEWFKERRREAFRAVAESYWDIQDTLFHYAFIMCIGAVDNFGKNTYPYKMKPLASGGRWRWIQDDLDSILGINNAGYDNVPTWSEYEDGTYYGGSASVFWTLIKEAYRDNYVSTVSGLTCSGVLSMGNKILNKMNYLVGGTDIFHGVLDYFKTRFWDKAQKYFPISAYNYDATFKYEAAWIAGANAQAAPLPQSLGDHYSAEYKWVYSRLMYILSLFKVGPFGDVQDKSLGQIGFRPDNLYSITLTPFYKMYPAIRNGETMENGGRTDVGDECTFVGPYSQQAQTTMAINASHMLSDIGDLKDLKLSTSLTPQLSIEGRKLARFKIGDEDVYNDTVITPAVYYTQEEIDAAEEGDDAYGKTTSDVKTPAVYDSNVKTNVQYLTFSDVPCMEELEARNASSLVGSIDLSPCKRLRKAYLSGTNITGVVFANGQPIENISLPDTISTISMKNMKFLTPETTEFPSDMSGISLLQIENCGFDALEMLANAYNSENSSLTNISITLPDITDIDYALMAILSGLATNKDKDGNTHNYHGVNTDGSPADTGTPNIIGSVQLTTPFYMSDFEALGMNPSSERDYGEEGLKINGIPSLGALQMIYNPNLIYIAFADPEVLEALLANDIGDGVGVTTEQAASTTSIGTIFENNTDITSFNEFKYFHVTGSLNNTFNGCSALTEIELPSTCTSLGTNAGRTFNGCSSLEKLTINVPFSSSGTLNFSDCTSLTKVVVPDIETWVICSFSESSGNFHPFSTLPAGTGGHLYIGDSEITSVDFTTLSSDFLSIPARAFERCAGIQSVIVPNSLGSIGKYAFRGCTSLTSINIPSGLFSIGDNAFEGCTSLTGITLPSALQSIGGSAFKGCTSLSGTIVISQSVSTGSNCFAGCTGITNAVIQKSSISMDSYYNIFAEAGNGTGTIFLKNYTATGREAPWKFKNVVIDGDLVFTATNGGLFRNNSIQTVRIYGDCTTTSTYSIIYHSSAIKFFEVLGDFGSTSANYISDLGVADNSVILHLGGSSITVSPSQLQINKIARVYVGDGTNDDAVYALYQNDANWSQYLSKLAKWSEYDGEYKIAPTIPE